MNSTSASTATSTYDAGRVILGGTGRLPAPKSAATADNGKVKLGGTGRLPAIRD